MYLRSYMYITELILVLQILFWCYRTDYYISDKEVPVGTIEYFTCTKVPVGTPEQIQRYIHIFILILYSVSYHMSL